MSTPAKTLKNPVVFTGNRLIDGEVVWLAANGKWVESVAAAHAVLTTVEHEIFAAQTEAADRNNVVVEPYEIDVAIEGGQIVPVRFREQIRAAGPTIRLDLGKQANISARAA